MSDRALFLVLEGGEGVGKSTQAALLSSWMDELGVDHVLTREPGGTKVGEAIREIVLGQPDLEMPAETELFLILAARAAFVSEIVRPALAAGKVVLADRFALSTLAYQGFGRGIDLDSIRSGLEISTRGVEPDLYVVLDVPSEEGTERQRRGGMAPDRIEREGDAFLRTVRDGYLSLAESEPGVVLISGIGSPEGVQEGIRSVLRTRFPETFGRPSV